jgi:hypothetical protein
MGVVKRWWVRAALLVAAVALVVGWGLFASAQGARRSLTEGRDALTRARDLLADGETARAADAFELARAGFAEAAERTEGAWFRVVGVVPFLGRTPDAVHAVAEAGARVAEAGATLSRAVEDVGGIASLAPTRGRIPVEPIVELAPDVARARDEVTAALAVVEAAPRSLLLGPVGPARRDAETELRSLDELLATASTVLERLPSFLGADGPRRYFFGAQNPAELRGTGGIMGAYAILTVEDGALSFSGFEPVQSLPVLSVQDVPPPSEEYARNYDQFRGERRFWLAINLTPDFPTAAEVVVDAYEAATGERLDGVILADPFALAALMRLTGPTTVPGLDVTLTADDVVAFTANEAYALLPDNEARKRLLGAVAEGVLAMFLERGELDSGDVRSLARVAARGHLLVYSADPVLQGALEETGAGGALRTDEGQDLLAVVENSSGGNKVDFYEDRAVSYEVWLRPDGSARGTATVTLTNEAPTSGLPKYVIGPYLDYSLAGESAQILGIYCGPGCRLIEAERDGERIGLGEGSELGHRFYRDAFRTPSGETSELRLSWYLPRAWVGGSLGGTYRLALLDQPTIRPDAASVVIHLPEGMDAAETTTGMRIEDGRVTWQGSLEGRFEIEVDFGPPALVRLWRWLTPG